MSNTIKFGKFKVKFTQETKFQLENGPQVKFIFLAVILTCSRVLSAGKTDFTWGSFSKVGFQGKFGFNNS